VLGLGVALAGHEMEDGTVDRSQARGATAKSRRGVVAEKSSHHTALGAAKITLTLQALTQSRRDLQEAILRPSPEAVA
jgi:hypothetical protein